MNKISLGLHQENLVIEQPNIDGIPPIASSEEAAIAARSPAAKRKAKSATTTMPAKKQATAAVNSEPAYVQELTQATTALTLGDRSGNAALLQKYKDEGLAPTQWGGHVEFTSLQGPWLIGGWKRQEDDPDNEFLQIEHKYTIVRLVPPSGFSIGMIELLCVDKEIKKKLKLLIPWPTCFVKVANHVGLQDGEQGEFVFHRNHSAMESMINNQNLKVEDHSEKPKRIVCGGLFQFQRPMKMDAIISEVITIPITDADIDKSKGEEVPPGGVLKVLQLIIEEEPETEETEKTAMKVTKQREGKLGKEPGGVRCEHINHMNNRDVCRASSSSLALVATVATRHDPPDGPDVTYTDGAGPFLFEGPVVVDTHMALPDLSGAKRHRSNTNTTTIVPSDDLSDL